MTGLPSPGLLRESPRAALMSRNHAAADAVRPDRWPTTRADFTRLVEVYADRLLRYAVRQVGNMQDAEDLVQDVFAKAFRRPPEDEVVSVGAYLYRSVANACIDHLRRRGRSLVYCQEVGIDELLAADKGPAEATQAAEDARRAEGLLKRLPAEQAEAIRLRVFDGLRLNEIADVLNCPVNTVCSRLRYGFQKLRSIATDKD